MGVEFYSVLGTKMAVRRVGNASGTRRHLVWGHGWGQSSSALTHLAESLAPFAHSSLIDFPGFGDSPQPPDAWGTASYAKAVAEYLEATSQRHCIWIGHSFGCRVGLQLASSYPHLTQGMVLIAAAGLRPTRGMVKRLRIHFQTKLFKFAKHILSGQHIEYLRSRLGSRDYASAGSLRQTLTRVVNEDLTEAAKQVTCPTVLIYGRGDTETPIDIGERLSQLIGGSQLIILENYDHNTIVSDGSHQITNIIRQFLMKVGR